MSIHYTFSKNRIDYNLLQNQQNCELCLEISTSPEPSPSPCSCDINESKVSVTFNGITKLLTVCDSESWGFCGSPMTGYAVANAQTEYIPNNISPTGLRVTLSSGFNSLGNCDAQTIIGAGTTWIYDYALNAYNCPIGNPILISESSEDTTDLCNEPGACCHEECFGMIYTPTLSLI